MPQPSVDYTLWTAKTMTLEISNDVKISPNVTLIMGSNVFIGPGVHIVGNGIVKFGDYSRIHAGCFINVPHSHSVVEFGCNTWIGERAVLDGTGGIVASHNVGVGIAAQLYSHIAHGDVMAGCRFMAEKKLTIGKDAWFVGHCLVSPVDVGERSLAMLGSTITKNMLPNTIYAGVPAKDMTSKMGRPWVERSSVDRLSLFHAHLHEYLTLHQLSSAPVVGVAEFPTIMNDDVTYFNVMTRTYTKRSTSNEINFMKWITSWRARFVPEESSL